MNHNRDADMAKLQQAYALLDRIERSFDEDTVLEPKDWGEKQAVSYEDLDVGRIYIAHYKVGSEKLLCLSKPFVGRYGIWKIKVAFGDEFQHGKETSLADAGLTPYHNGRFNQNCWYETTDEIVSTEKVKELGRSLKFTSG